jgi:negative elongation factor A
MTSSSITTNNTSSKDEDVAFWLHNKLGSHADLWSSFSISSTLTQEHLLSIKSILWSLDTLVKVKLLLSFIHIPKRNINEVNYFLNISNIFICCYCFFSGKIY